LLVHGSWLVAEGTDVDFTLNQAGFPICWAPILQRHTAFSTSRDGFVVTGTDGQVPPDQLGMQRYIVQYRCPKRLLRLSCGSW